MLHTTPSQLVETGIAALRAGDHPRACTLLTQAAQLDPNNERAWLWLAGATSDRIARRSYLERVLALNPNNSAAREGLEALDGGVHAPLPSLPPLLAPPVNSSAGKTTTRLGFLGTATSHAAVALPRGADDPLLVDYIISEIRLLRPDSDIVREVANRIGGTWSEAERVVAFVRQQRSKAILVGRLWQYGMIVGLIVVAVFVLGGLYLFGHGLPPGVIPGKALRGPVIKGMFLVISGTFTVAGAVFDMEWFLAHRGARFVLTYFGRTCARVIYGLLGAVLVAFGMLIMSVR